MVPLLSLLHPRMNEFSDLSYNFLCLHSIAVGVMALNSGSDIGVLMTVSEKEMFLLLLQSPKDSQVKIHLFKIS